jgi:two-component system, LytTR family, sensor kinase
MLRPAFDDSPRESPWRSRLTLGGIIVLGWTACALFLFSKGIASRMLRPDPTPWRDLLMAWLAGSYISAALTPAVLWLGARFPIGRRTWPPRVAIHVVASVAFALLQLGIEAAISGPFGLVSFPVAQSFWTYFPVLLALGFHGSMLQYWLILGLQALWQYHQQSRRHEREALELLARAASLETQVVQARLGALKMQLQPHFLFNTLNAVVALIRAGRGREAEDTLAHLSDLLRWVLDDGEQQEVPLARELQHVKLYLAVERVRFADRLQVDLRVQPETLDAAVPHLCLQPIVENAIRHGVEAVGSAGRIVIASRRIDAQLQLTVQDDGPGFRHGQTEPGIGLANTRSRLAELYGGRAAVTTANAPGGGAMVTLTLPFRECEEPTPARALAGA